MQVRQRKLQANSNGHSKYKKLSGINMQRLRRKRLSWKP